MLRIQCTFSWGGRGEEGGGMEGVWNHLVLLLAFGEWGGGKVLHGKQQYTL